MGKRSEFERKPRDLYPTPYEAVIPLFDHLETNIQFVEPCAGNGILIDHIETQGHKCIGAFDIEPLRNDISKEDATTLKFDFNNPFYFITNPPWDRKLLHPMIENLSDQQPTWLLFDADWVHTKQSIAFLPRLKKIVSVGRVKWFPESKMTGKDNCAWYLFDKPMEYNSTSFYGRQ